MPGAWHLSLCRYPGRGPQDPHTCIQRFTRRTLSRRVYRLKAVVYRPGGAYSWTVGRRPGVASGGVLTLTS